MAEKTFDPEEIGNPKKTNARRMEEAGEGEPPLKRGAKDEPEDAPKKKRDMATSGPRKGTPVPPADMLKRHQAPMPDDNPRTEATGRYVHIR